MECTYDVGWKGCKFLTTVQWIVSAKDKWLIVYGCKKQKVKEVTEIEKENRVIHLVNKPHSLTNSKIAYYVRTAAIKFHLLQTNTKVEMSRVYLIKFHGVPVIGIRQ